MVERRNYLRFKTQNNFDKMIFITTRGVLDFPKRCTLCTLLYIKCTCVAFRCTPFVHFSTASEGHVLLGETLTPKWRMNVMIRNLTNDFN